MALLLHVIKALKILLLQKLKNARDKKGCRKGKDFFCYCHNK